MIRDIKATRQAYNMKRIDGILISVTGQIWRPGTSTTDVAAQKLTPEQFRLFQVYCAERLCNVYRQAIETQRYKYGSHRWQPLSRRYLLFKKRNNLSLDIWKATGLLQESLKVYKKGNYLIVGFRPNERYPKTRIKINSVARWLEYGTANPNGSVRIPARPMFRPLLTYERKNVSRTLDTFRKENNI